MQTQTDMFGEFGAEDALATTVEGLTFAPDFIDQIEESRLIAAVDATGLTPFKFQGWEGKRLTSSFGWHYDFGGGSLAEAGPIPAWLTSIRDRAACFATITPDELVQALLIRYDRDAGIGWHRDRPHFEHVIGISMGEAAILRLRRRTSPGRTGFKRAFLPLPPRSIYHLSGEARQAWEHSIAPMSAPRWSVTFRSLSKLGRRKSIPSVD